MYILGKMLIGILTVLHVGIVLVILGGWLFPEITYIYGLCLIGTALSWLLYKRCVLVDVEYVLRRFFKLPAQNHDKSFTATFINRVVGKSILSDRLVIRIGVTVMSVSIPYWLYSFFA